MRLLMTTDTVGGVWTFTTELSRQLLQRGHAVSLVSFGPAPTAAQMAWVHDQQVAFAASFSFTSSLVPLEWSQQNERSLADGEPVLAAAADVFRPDLLVSSQFCYGAVSFPIPRIVIAHSDVLSWARACKPSALDPSPWLNQYTSLVQRGLLQANALVAPTQWMLSALVRSFFIGSRHAIIPNGRTLPPLPGPSTRQLQAVTAGRLWDEAKGLDTLLEAPLPISTFVAGNLNTPGEQAASTPSTPQNLTLLGELSTPELHTLFRQSSVYLCTSRYEPFGLAALEAALCGCALLARDLPSLREVWGDAALYFTDAISLGTELRRLADDPDALAAAQARSGQRAAHYTADRMTEAYLAVFQAVLQQPRVTPHVA